MAALVGIPTTIEYAKLATALCGNDNSAGVLWGKRLTAPSSPITQSIVTDALEWGYTGGAVPDTTLRQMANYLVWLTSPYFLTAKSIITGGSGGGSVVPGGGSGYAYRELPATIAADSSTYQNDELILGKDLSYVILNNQLLTVLNGDFTFNAVTGTLTFITVTLFANDTLTVPFNMKL